MGEKKKYNKRKNLFRQKTKFEKKYSQKNKLREYYEGYQKRGDKIVYTQANVEKKTKNIPTR